MQEEFLRFGRIVYDQPKKGCYTIDVFAEKKSTITIIGAGLTGCFLAILLAKRGYDVVIYERLSKEDIITTNSKRSFNLTFYNYGVQCLKEINVWEKVMPDLIHLKGSVTQIAKDTRPIFARFDYNDMPYYAIQRAKLLNILIKEALANPKITIHFSTDLLSLDRHEQTIQVEKTNSNTIQTVPYTVILGTDGANSLTRSFLQQGRPTVHRQEFVDYEYKQIIITKEMAETIQLLPDMQHVWTRKQQTMIAFPNGDGSFTGMLILPKNDDEGFASLTSLDRITTFFKTLFPNFLPVIDQISSQITENPLGYFVTVYTDPWYYKDSIAIFGDAAHACLPFYGIGMSVGFGDCMEFVNLVDTYHGDWQTIFPQYQALRKKNTDIIANLAKESFVRFRRYKKADPVAIYDRLEATLHTIFPKIFQPPLFNRVANDPNRAEDFFKTYSTQRKRAVLYGLPIFVAALTATIGIAEKIQKLSKK